MKKTFEQLARRQQGLLDALLALARRQLEMVKENAAEEPLERLLRDRAALMDKLAEGDAEFRKAAEDAGSGGAAALEKLETALRNILAADAETGRLLKDLTSGIQGRIRTMHKGATALRGYGGRESGQGRFISKKG